MKVKKETKHQKRRQGKQTDKDGGWSTTSEKPSVSAFTEQAKMNAPMEENATPIDYLELFFTDELMDIIVYQINLSGHPISNVILLVDFEEIKNTQNINLFNYLVSI